MPMHNISVIFTEATEVHREKHRPATSNQQTFITSSCIKHITSGGNLIHKLWGR